MADSGMPYSANFLMTLQTEILVTETLDFLELIICLESFRPISVCLVKVI